MTLKKLIALLCLAGLPMVTADGKVSVSPGLEGKMENGS